MSRDSVYLLDILKAAKLALNYLEGKTKEEFFQDNQCQDAVIPYEDVDLAIVWDTVQNDLPRLIALIEPVIPPEE